MRARLRVFTNALLLAGLWAMAPAAHADEQAELDAALLAFQRGDVVDALQRYEALAEAGSSKAMAQLGYIHDQSEENDLAVQWYRRSAEAGNPEGQHGLAGMYAKGEGVEQDYAQARDWMMRAADQGYTPSIRTLWANAEEGGLGLEADQVEALRWLQAGVAAGDQSSMQRLARAYRNGELGLDANEAAAAELEARADKTR